MGVDGKGRGRGVAPTDAICAHVEQLTAKVRVAHLARAVCAGLAAFALTLALAVAGGIELRSAEAIALAAGVGVVSALTWQLGLGVAPHVVARDLDRSLAFGGALLAAFEASARPRQSGVAELGAARVFRTLDRGRAEAAVVPHSLGFVALPVVAFAALALAVEARSDRAIDRSRAMARASGAVQGAQNLLAEASAEGAPMDSPAAEAAAAAVEEAAASLAEAGADEAAREEAMSRMGEALDQLAQESQDPELVEALRELALDAELHGGASAETSEGDGAGSDPADGGGEAAPGGDGAPDSDAVGGGGSDGPPTTATSPGKGDPLDPGALTPMAGPTSAAPRPAVPERYRALIQRWESRSGPPR